MNRRLHDSGSSGAASLRADSLTSVELLQRARGGESEALERLLQRYLPAFREWASRRMPPWARNSVDTDDLVQETLLHTIRQLQHFEPRRDGALQAYLHQALRNKVRDRLRQLGRRRPVTFPSQEPDRRPSPEEAAIGHEAYERYEAALARLSARDREAIVARIELRQGWAEVAAALGKPSADAARMAVARALRRLAEEMVRVA